MYFEINFYIKIPYVTPGNRFEELESSLLSQMRELSDRGLHPPVQSQPILGSGSQPIVAATDQLGVSAPLQGINLPNPINPVFRLSTAPVSDETPIHRLATSDLTLQELELNFAATRRAIDLLYDGGLASLAMLLDYIMSKFPAASKSLAQPSSRRFRVFEAAGLVEESSQRSSNLSWFDHVRFACESAQSKFEAKIYEGKSLSTIMPSVSRVEKVSDSPCQGKELKVNSQVYDLMSSKPSDTRSVPMSVRDAAVLEKTLRSTLESYNFQLWTMTALFRFFGDSGQIPLDDPLLD